ncbi:MAG: hypothetical protein ACTSQL_01100 [Promethearchaeota archaeon]
MVNLSQQDIGDLRKQGYSDEQINKALSEIEQEDLQTGNTSKTTIKSNSQASAFASGKMDDMARYQLELNDLLEQTEHILKGDVVNYEKGIRVWQPNPYPENNPLNKEGIRKIMLELQYYINRHIILGDYEEKDINIIMKNYGKSLTNFMFMKYEEMGMDTEEKRQEYSQIVMNVVNLVYASYSRAKDGGERRSLREMISIQQTHQSQGAMIGGGQQMMQPKARGILNPMRYVNGKYV